MQLPIKKLPRLPIGRKEYIFLSACTMMLTALGIDIMLPALSELRRHFGLAANSNDTAGIIIFFFMGQVAQLVFGILSDRFGRLPVLRIGFPLYIVGGIAATFAPDLTTMCAARFIAGIGASAVFTTTIAGVRDRFVGDQMARTMSLILTIFLFTPIVAPFLGMMILHVGSWKAVFLTPPIFAVIVFLWSLRLNESHPPERRSTLAWQSIRKAIGGVIGNRIFLRYTFVTTFLFSGLTVWVSASERIIGEMYGTPKLFPWIFGSMGLAMSMTSLYNSRLSTRYGARRVIRVLVIVYTVVAILLLLATLYQGDPPDPWVLYIAVGLLLAINLAIEPNSSALALEPLGDNAGIAASVYGTMFFFVGSTLGAFIGMLMVHGVLPLVLSFVILGAVAVVLVWMEKRS